MAEPTTQPRPTPRFRESSVPLGEGGTARVWAGWLRFPWGEEQCAVKRIRSELLTRRNVEAMEREAKIGRDIARGHPGLVAVEDYGIDEKGPYLVMERVDGARLHDVHREIRGDWRVIRRIARDALSMLRYIHTRGVLHRDISSGNILIDHRGMVRICDLGMARRMSQPQTAASAGTVVYASPQEVPVRQSAG